MKRGKGFLWFLWAIITIIGLSHLLRAILGWKLTVIASSVPLAVSYIAFIVLGYLSYRLFIFLRTKH